MRKILSPIILFFLSFACGPFFSPDKPAQAEEQYAQDPAAQSPPPAYYSGGAAAAIQPVTGGMQGRISLDLRNIDVVDALKFLSIKGGINIIATKSVTGRVTLRVEDVPIQDVFDIMLRSNNLAYDKKGEIYNVMTQEEYRALYGARFADVREVFVTRLKYSIPAQIFDLLDALKSEIGVIHVDPESGNILIMDSPGKIQVMQEALERFEQECLVRVFQLNYAEAKDIEEQLKTQLDLKKVGMVKADERSNQVIVQTLPERMKQIEKLINLLDQKTKEVLIDAHIIKVNLSDEFSRGVEWEGLFDLGVGSGLSYLGSYPFSWMMPTTTEQWQSREQARKEQEQSGYGVGSYPFSGTSSSYSAGKKSIGTQEMHLGIVDKNRDFDVIIKYLRTVGETRILSNPKLVVVNNKEAKIHVGEEIPYVISTTVGAGETTASVAEEVKFEEIGILLSVVPTINDDGYVTLKVKSEISSLIDYYITPTGNKIPIKDTSTAETTVLVKEGTSIIIGGLRKERKADSSEHVPFLGKIPILGKLFSKITKTKEHTELMIILTPKLITGDILFTKAGETAAGAEAIKSIKDYSGLKSEVFVPLDEKELKTKGFKK
ncbi:MAG: secretin N-terminal domain-containing protein [Candidatus Omnitrophota bacterium]